MTFQASNSDFFYTTVILAGWRGCYCWSWYDGSTRTVGQSYRNSWAAGMTSLHYAFMRLLCFRFRYVTLRYELRYVRYLFGFCCLHLVTIVFVCNKLITLCHDFRCHFVAVKRTSRWLMTLMTRAMVTAACFKCAMLRYVTILLCDNTLCCVTLCRVTFIISFSGLRSSQ